MTSRTFMLREYRVGVTNAVFLLMVVCRPNMSAVHRPTCRPANSPSRGRTSNSPGDAAPRLASSLEALYDEIRRSDSHLPDPAGSGISKLALARLLGEAGPLSDLKVARS